MINGTVRLVHMPGRTRLSVSPKSGMSKMADTIVLAISMNAYARRVDVEFFIDGKHLQHRLHAAEPKQHVTLLKSDPIAQPIFGFFDVKNSLSD